MADPFLHQLVWLINNLRTVPEFTRWYMSNQAQFGFEHYYKIEFDARFGHMWWWTAYDVFLCRCQIVGERPKDWTWHHYNQTYILLACDVLLYNIRRTKCRGLDDQCIWTSWSQAAERDQKDTLSLRRSKQEVLMSIFNEYSIPHTFKATLATQLIVAFLSSSKVRQRCKRDKN